MLRISRSGWYSLAFIALGALVADQVSKYAVERSITVDSHHVIIPGLVAGRDLPADMAARNQPRRRPAWAVRARADSWRRGGECAGSRPAAQRD